MKDFKIKVTPQESELVQKLLFLAGYKWVNGSENVNYINQNYLYLNNQKIYHGYKLNVFNSASSDELTFEEFVNLIELELNEKFQN